MSFGVAIDGFAYTYGTFSVITSGVVSTGNQTFAAKLSHPDITDWRVVFIPTGVRSPGDEEVRPVLRENSYAVYANSPSDLSPHRYIVLGR